MSLPAALLNFAGLAGCSRDEVRELQDALRRELAPTSALEVLLVEQMVLAVDRLHNAARLEPHDKIDKDWLRYQTMAERSFWKAHTSLEKMRRQAARAAKAEAAKPIPQPQPTPSPIPQTPASPPAPAARPAPAPKPRPILDGLDLPPADLPAFLDLTITPPPPRGADRPIAAAS